MNDRQSIIGFTEAELGLFLAVMFLVFSLAGHSAAPNYEQLLAEANARAKEAEQVAADAEDRANRAVKAAAEANARANTAPKLRDTKLRSAQTPTCAEEGIGPKPYLFEVTLAADGYEVGDRAYSWEGLQLLYSRQLQEARATGCKYTVKVFFDPELSSGALGAKQRELSQMFILSPLQQTD